MADIVVENKNHHPKLYFPDGNLVICCRGPDATPTYFKVHQSVLSAHSPVIKDIIGLPPTGENSDSYDGAPFIEFSETPEDVESFLNFYYYPFSPGNLLREDDLEIAFKIYRVLELAEKFEVEDLKTAILERIESTAPITLLHFSDPEYKKRRRAWDPAAFIRVARRFHPAMICPAVLYELSSRELSIPFGQEDQSRFAGYGARWDFIDTDYREHVEDCRRGLHHRYLEEIRLLMSQAGCSSSNGCESKIQTFMWDVIKNSAKNLDVLNLVERFKNIPGPAYKTKGICSQCSKSLKTQGLEIQKTLYNNLAKDYRGYYHNDL